MCDKKAPFQEKRPQAKQTITKSLQSKPAMSSDIKKTPPPPSQKKD